MLLRPDGDATICIGQPAHAFLSGQLAAAWRPRPEPFEEVVLAATQHDAGMADWDAAPELNPETGLPQSFMEMSLGTHLRLWSHAPQRVLPQSRYAALLVSLHGTALYEMRDLTKLDDPTRVTRYLEEQRALQRRLAAGFDADQLQRNQQLLWAWDFLSLGLCLRWEDRSVHELTLRAGTIDPWPFAADSVHLHTDGRRLEGRYDTQESLHAALDAAPWVTLDFELTRRP
ncbi:MAG TPA: DUF3891 family protein [Thermoleophilaceae bacterium]